MQCRRRGDSKAGYEEELAIEREGGWGHEGEKTVRLGEKRVRLGEKSS